MSQLTDKYGDVYILAQSLGVSGLNAAEADGKITLSGTAPTAYALNQIWDKVKAIDPDLKDGDFALDMGTARSDIYGEYEVKAGDTLSAIAKKVSNGKLSYTQIFEANTNILSDPDKIQVGQKLIIPNF